MSFDFFYSDPHFGHQAAALRFRKFASVEEHDQKLIKEYQRTVSFSDVTLWLGDCFFHDKETAREILSSLPGRKCLLRGNHDWGRSRSWFASIGFDWVMDGTLELPPIQGRPVRASHLPYMGTRHHLGEDEREPDHRPIRRKGEILIHGHTHLSLRPKRGETHMIHVGVDAWNMRPVSYEDVANLILPRR